MKTIIALLTGLVLTAGCISVPVLADPDDSQKWGQFRMHEGREMRHGEYSDQKGYRQAWKANLTDEQRKKVDKLQLEYKKEKTLLRAKIKEANAELATLITKDSPNTSDINKKIDQIVNLKKAKLQLKTNHKIEVRKLLTDDQRVQFDMAVMRSMSKGKRR